MLHLCYVAAGFVGSFYEYFSLFLYMYILYCNIKPVLSLFYQEKKNIIKNVKEQISKIKCKRNYEKFIFVNYM